MIFTYKDRKNNNEIKKTTIAAGKFIHRFLLHVLPEKVKETICEMMFRLTGTDIILCSECKKGQFDYKHPATQYLKYLIKLSRFKDWLLI